MKLVNQIASVLVFLGGLNYLLVLVGWDLDRFSLGSTVSLIVYLLFGLAILYKMFAKPNPTV